jgi:hypothetical protein
VCRLQVQECGLFNQSLINGCEIRKHTYNSLLYTEKKHSAAAWEILGKGRRKKGRRKRDRGREGRKERRK